MKIHLSTSVSQDYNSVFARFNKDLLVALTPPGIKLNPVEFGGSAVDDVVHLEVTILGIFKQEWYNVITESDSNAQRNYFVDEGVRLPSVLKTWRHEHIIEKDGDGAKIIDLVTYSSPFFLLDWLMYPFLYFQFAYRRPIYRKFFK